MTKPSTRTPPIIGQSLDLIHLPPDVLRVCLTHAFSTEKEEIMGMLLGDWKRDVKGRECAHVTGLSLLTRSDKRKDRVEIAPEQLHLAVTAAEHLEQQTQSNTRVIGWYHSHPHITVFPSHVDLRTQFSQQMMDSRFFGLIVSCFNTEADMSQKIQITCFQAKDNPTGPLTHVQVPFFVPTNVPLSFTALQTLTTLPRKIHEEHQSAFAQSLAPLLKSSTTTNLENGTECGDSHSPLQTYTSDGMDIRSSVGYISTQLHNGNVFGQSVVELVDKIVGPSVRECIDRRKKNMEKIQQLQQEQTFLLGLGG